jgi:hypothetical protein
MQRSLDDNTWLLKAHRGANLAAALIWSRSTPKISKWSD